MFSLNMGVLGLKKSKRNCKSKNITFFIHHSNLENKEILKNTLKKTYFFRFNFVSGPIFLHLGLLKFSENNIKYFDDYKINKNKDISDAPTFEHI